MSLNTIHKRKTAVLFMDFQNYILQNFISKESAEKVVQRAKKVLDSARKEGFLIIHVTVCFRSGYPEVDGKNKIFSLIRDNHLGIAGSEAAEIHPLLRPEHDEPVVSKRRIGAFGGTDLEMILRSKNIETVSNVVLATFYQAFDLDYTMAVIHDACADGDENTHTFLTQTFFSRLGDVLSADEFVKRADMTT